MASTRFVALLRGINVGGNKKVVMADLREVVSSLGHDDVRTYLQSGNVCFSSSRTDADALASEIEEAVHEGTGIESRVLVRTVDEVRAVVEANPLPEAVAQPSRFHCVFLERDPDAERLRSLLEDDWGDDVVRPGPGVLYVWYPDGMQRSKLATVLERRLGVATTARNWNTVTKLLDG